MPDPTPARRLPGRQQEARSNDSAVLVAAREVFSARGHDASMAEIARHAGVGVGSIYRRYPTKEALVEALRVHAVSEAAGLAREVATAASGGVPGSLVGETGAASPGDESTAGIPTGAVPTGAVPTGAVPTGAVPTGAVATFLARQITGATGPILQPPGGGGPISAELADASEELRAGLEGLVARDRADGLLPQGFTTADVMQLLLHLRPALPFPRARADALHLRYLGLAMHGLHEQARAGVALGEGPSWSEWLGSWRD